MISHSRQFKLMPFWLTAVLLLVCGCSNSYVVASSNPPDKPAKNVAQPPTPIKRVETKPAIEPVQRNPGGRKLQPLY